MGMVAQASIKSNSFPRRNWIATCLQEHLRACIIRLTRDEVTPELVIQKTLLLHLKVIVLFRLYR